MKEVILRGFFLLVLGASFSCSHLYFLAKNPDPPKVRVLSLKVQKVGLTSVLLMADMELKNPNDFKIEGRDFSYRVLAAQKELASFTYKKAVALDGQKALTIEVPVQIDARAAFALVGKILEGKEEVLLTLVGSGVFDSPFGEVEMEFEEEKVIES